MTPEFLVIGGGLAGMLTAYHLAVRGVGRVLLLEKESIPGLHASGRSSAMVMQIPRDPVIGRLSRRGMQQLALFNATWPGGIGLVQHGSLLMGSHGDLAGYESAVREAARAGVVADFIDGDQCAQLVPPLNPTAIESALCCPSDGAVCVETLLAAVRRASEATGRFSFIGGCEVEELVVEAGAIVGVRTNRGRFDAGLVINAAGGWARDLTKGVGAIDVAMVCRRRHVFVTIPTHPEAEGWPVAWNVTEGFMFRPYKGGLLMSVCDDRVMEPSDYSADSQVKVVLREKAARLVPTLSPPQIDHAWVGLRASTLDRRPVVGPDPLVRGLFWVAGLGSHGVATAGAVGEMACELIVGGTPASAAACDPARFATLATA